MAKSLTIAALLLVLASCSGPRRRAANAPAATPSPTPAASPKVRISAPPPVDRGAKTQKGSGLAGDYAFTYEQVGEQLTATFAPGRLPRDQQIVVAAARSVIESTFGEKMEGFPRRVEWRYGEATHAILLEGKAYDYVCAPLTDKEGGIPSLVFWRVAKGSAG